MPNKLKLKKGFFKSTTEIFSGERLVGSYKASDWKNTIKCELNHKEYIFKNKGFLKPVTNIIDVINDKQIGEITYSTWKSKANISLMDKTYTWKYNSFLSTKWSISNSDGTEIYFNGSSSNGEIEVNTENNIEPLVLSGIYISNYNMQIIFISLITIFVSVMSATISRH
jgi:hypothetical protein